MKLTAHAVAILVTAGSTGALAEDHAFRTDAGALELTYTVLNDEALIGNYYRTDEPVTLTRVEFAAGDGLAGNPIEIIIYSDPDSDGNPVNAALLSRTPVVVGPQTSAVNGLFVDSFDIAPTTVEGGFVVGVWIVDQLPFQGLVGYDGSWSTAASGRRLPGDFQPASFSVDPPFPANGMGGTGPIDPVGLANNLQIRLTQFNWVIRAFGDTFVASTADMNNDGQHTFSDIAAFLSMFRQSDADLNNDGQSTYADIALFLNAWLSAGE